ncbi:MAG: 2-hydroxyacyl-CoA dehydratase [Candidatus Bathyarchaeota archaeon]|nr:MAG: 2-hydroxyacyl-CoA dehydratase [Candidatus Bathyarchaeota archaeon]
MNQLKPARRPTVTRGFYRKHVHPFYETAHQAKTDGKPVAWVASTFPVEVLSALDVIPVWPENYAALCASMHASVELCEKAEKEGFSKDLCSYARCVIGSLQDSPSLPENGLPKPDLLVASTCACDTHMKWFQVVSQRLNVPFYLLDAPHLTFNRHGEALQDYHVKFYVSQLKSVIHLIETQLGTELDDSKLKEAVKLSDHTSRLWGEIQAYRKAIPTPMGARDAFSAVFFMLSMPSSHQAIEFYTLLRNELKERVANQFGLLENEECRLVWDNLPLWFDLGLFQYLNSLNAVVVAETFSHVWMGELNPSKPLESLAEKYLLNFANCSIEKKINLMVTFVKEHRADGVILPTNWGCRMMSVGETLVKEAIAEKLNVPSLIIEVDSSDWRRYDEGYVKRRLKIFLDMLRQTKTSR